jgi:hypothetical protein
MATTTMTTQETQKIAYERALARAHRVGLEITGQGRMRTTGDRFLLVSSATEPGRSHVVVIEGSRLHCDCQASNFGRMCQHRALAHEYPVPESEQRRQLGVKRAALEMEEREEEPRRSPALDQWTPREYGQDVRHALRLADDARPVTCWK